VAPGANLSAQANVLTMSMDSHGGFRGDAASRRSRSIETEFGSVGA
jgi:hypothetical protein